MKIEADSVDSLLAALSPERLAMVSGLRDVIRANLPPGYAEHLQYGGLGWVVPHSRYPDGYHCNPADPVPFAGIISQKRHVGLYLFCIYVDPAMTEWFVSEYQKTGKKLDMGKSCVRFTRLDQIPFALVGETVKRIPIDAFLAHYEAGIPESSRKKLAARATAREKSMAKGN